MYFKPQVNCSQSDHIDCYVSLQAISHYTFSWSLQCLGVSKTTSSLSEQLSHAHNSHPLTAPPTHSISVLTTNSTSSSTPPITTTGMSRHSQVSVDLYHTHTSLRFQCLILFLQLPMLFRFRVQEAFLLNHPAQMTL